LRRFAATLLVSGVVLAACGSGSPSPATPRLDASGLPVGQPVTQAEVARFPESRLQYPGSTVVRQVGASQTPTQPGEEPNPAYTGAILTAEATPSQLYAWYGAQLKARGFVPAVDYRPGSQTSGRAWQIHHRVQVQVGVFNPTFLRPDLGIDVTLRPGDIAYEAVLVGYPPGLPKD